MNLAAFDIDKKQLVPSHRVQVGSLAEITATSSETNVEGCTFLPNWLPSFFFSSQNY